MNALILNGVLVGDPRMSVTKDGATKAVFTVACDGKDLPLHFACLAFGYQGETVRSLRDGDEILLSGRMTASAVTKTMAIIANSIEILVEREDDHGNEGTAASE